MVEKRKRKASVRAAEAAEAREVEAERRRRDKAQRALEAAETAEMRRRDKAQRTSEAAERRRADKAERRRVVEADKALVAERRRREHERRVQERVRRDQEEADERRRADESGMLPPGLAERCPEWERLPAMRGRWLSTYVRKFISAMMVCAFCGTVVFGPNQNPGNGVQSMVREAPSEDIPPYILSNPLFPIEHIYTDTTCSEWWVCSDCKRSRAARALRRSYLVPYSTEYFFDLINVGTMGRQSLAILDGRMTVVDYFLKFSRCSFVGRRLFDAPLVAAVGTVNDPRTVLETVTRLIVRGLSHSGSLYHSYLAVIEHDKPCTSLAILARETVLALANNERDRGGGIRRAEEQAEADLVHTVQYDGPDANHPSVRMGKKDEQVIGWVTIRKHTLAAEGMLGAPPPAASSGGPDRRVLVTDFMGMATTPTSYMGMPTTSTENPGRITAEAALFTAFFPDGVGWWDGKVKIDDYVRLRMSDLFGAFSRCSYYLSGMYQMYQSIRLALASAEISYEAHIRRFLIEHEDKGEHDALKHVLRYTVPSTLKGTPRWHGHNFRKLNAYIDKFGTPSFFLTLTADEKSGTRFEEIADMEDFLDRFGTSTATWSHNPTLCARLFHHRLWYHLKNHILGGENIYGRVLHYFVRYEYQQRGSLHAHIILWVDPEDEERVGNEVVAANPGDWDEEAQEYRRPPDTPRNAERCRYYDLVTQHMIHTCARWGCRHKRADCKYHFPYKVHAGDTEFDPDIDAFVYYRPREQDKWIIPHHAIGLCLWGAHMNLLKVCAGNLGRYMCKYATKQSVTQILRVAPADLEALGILPPADVRAVHVALNNSREVCASEAAVAMSGVLKEVYWSDAVYTVNTAPPMLRRRLHTAASAASVHHVTKYINRETTTEGLADMTLYDYYRKHAVQSERNERTGKRFRELGIDRVGNLVYRVLDEDGNPGERLVMFSDFSPMHNTQGWAYQVLLANVPFTTERELCRRREDDYFLELIDRGIVADIDDLTNLVADYCSRHCLPDTLQNAIIDDIRVKYAYDDVAGRFAVEDLDLAPAVAQPGIPAMAGENPLIDKLTSDEFDADRTLDNLRDAQVPVVAEICAAGAAGSGGIFVLTGGPGAGKSHITKRIARDLRAAGKKVAILATTGRAAKVLSLTTAGTIHKMLKIPVRGTGPPLHESEDRFHYVKEADVFVFDECSMLSTSTLRVAVSQISHCRGVDFLDNTVLVFVGDPSQLPPVCRGHRTTPDGVCEHCPISRSRLFREWWDEGRVRVLRVPGNQRLDEASSPQLSAFLAKIRHQRPTQAEIDALMAACGRTREEAWAELEGPDHDPLAANVICTHNTDAREAAHALQRRHVGAAALAEVRPRFQRLHHRASEAAANAARDPKFHCISEIAVGSRVAFTANDAKADGYANGDEGVVTRLNYRGGGELSSVTVCHADTGALHTICRSNSDSVAVERTRVWRSRFPLALAYATTGHKSQGQTYRGKVYAMMRDGFAPGLAYVMLSRVTRQEDLRVISLRPEGLSPADFSPMPDLWAELEALPRGRGGAS